MAEELEDLFDDDEEQNEDNGAALDDATGAADEGAGLEDDMDEQQQGEQDDAGVGNLDDEERDLFGDLDDDVEEAAGGTQQEARGPPIDVHAPLLPRPAADKVLLMKVPNILRIDPRPFDPATFEGDSEEIVDERGVTRVRPRDINVIRWRYRQGEDGELQRESNARFVKWSDGSESIMLGDEILTFDRKQAAKAHTYLYAVRYDVIEGQAHLNTRVTVAPASLNSKLHKRLKMTVQQATQKVDKVRMHYAAKNPEAEKAEKERLAAEQAQLRLARERAAGRAAPRAARRPAFTAAYLEEEEYGGGPELYGGDEEDLDRGRDDELYRRRMADEEEEEAAQQRLRSAKRSTPPLPSSVGRKRAYEEEEEEAAEDAPPDAGKAPGIKVRRGAILDDDDD